jgi:hypothetical protein
MGQKRTCQRAVELVRFVPIQHRRGSNSGALPFTDRTLPFTLPCAAEKALNPGQRPAAYECGPQGTHAQNPF